MKIQLKPVAAALLMAGGIAGASFAVADNQVDELSAQAKELRSTVAQLQKKVSQLDDQVKVASARIKSNSNTLKKSPRSGVSSKDLRHIIAAQHDVLPFDLDVPGRAFVSTGPYTGVPFQFAGNDLVINAPSVNRDVQLLTIRKAIANRLKRMGLEANQEPAHSHLLFSGVVEGQANYTRRGGQPATSDFNLSNVSLDAFFMGPTNWLLGFFEITYNDGTPASDVFSSTSMYRVSNSRAYINLAFVTVGNFSKSPFYGTFGQYYVPFGRYSSVMVSSPLTKVLTRTKARALLLGFQQQDKDNTFYGSVYGFRGDSRVSAAGKINNGGLNLGYKFKTDTYSGRVGAGVIGNIADSSGIQTGANIQTAERLVHRVPGYNLQATLSVLHHFDFIAEYVGASTSFNPTDMSFNGHGAKPWAYDLEAAYSTKLFENHPSSVGIGYAESHEALALGLPMNRVSVVLNTSIWRNTLQSLEFRRDLQYPASYSASGGGVTTPTASGRIDHAVTAQFDYYF